MAAARFEALGLAVEREPFRASLDAIRRFKLALHLGGAAVAAAACAAAAVAPAFGALLGAAALAALARAGRWSLRAERAFDSGRGVESQNIVARSDAAAVPGAESAARAAHAAHAAPRIVFLAHLDSKSMRWPTLVSSSLLLGAAAGLALVTAWCALAALRLAPPPGAVAAAAAGAAIASALVAGLFNAPGDASPGAMDNASGIGVLLELARSLPRDDAFSGVDLTFVATGAEEIGLAGAMRWIARHAGECARERTLFVNFDSVGVGDSLLAMNVCDAATARGGGPRLERARVAPAAPAARAARIAPIARRVAARDAIPFRVAPGILGVGVDTMPIAARGFATITILGDVLGSASRRFHSPHDTVDHLREAALARAASFGRAVALAWAAEVAASADGAPTA